MNETVEHDSIDCNKKDELLELYAFFQNDITSETMLKLTNQVEELNPAHLFLLIATGGGDPREPLRFFNYIQAKGIKLTTINIGCCASAGVTLFLCGDDRVCPAYSSFALHEPHAPGKQYITRKMAEDNIAFNKKIEENTYRFVSHRCALEQEKWDEWHSSENVFISSQEALEHKIATSQQSIQIPRNAKIIKI